MSAPASRYAKDPQSVNHAGTSAALAKSTECPRLKVLLVDDDNANLDLLEEVLSSPTIEVHKRNDPEIALRDVADIKPDTMFVDLKMPGMTGLEVLERVVLKHPQVEVFLMTANYTSESAVQAIQMGASDYFEKPLDIERVRRTLQRIGEANERRHRLVELDEQAVNACDFEGMVGRSAPMVELFSKIARFAPHFQTVLISGPTGCGKELVARALHERRAKTSRFVVCNCAAIVESLIESELFGYVKGAFTGAQQDKAGVFEFADGGTVFLDEIGELPLAAQAKLLRVLQYGEVQRVGSPAVRKVNVRVIAATHRDLKEMSSQGTFRQDLYFRLSMLELRAPALSERREDLPVLLKHISTRYSMQYHKEVRGITRRAQFVLSRYGWPGNVRELENALGHAFIMAEGDMIDTHHLPEYLMQASAEDNANEGLCSMSEAQRKHALHVLSAVNGNKARAAQILEISRSTLYQLLRH